MPLQSLQNIREITGGTILPYLHYISEIGSAFWVLSRGLPGVTMVGEHCAVSLKDSSQHHFLGLLSVTIIHCTLNILHPVPVHITRQHTTSTVQRRRGFPHRSWRTRQGPQSSVPFALKPDLIYTRFTALVDKRSGTTSG